MKGFISVVVPMVHKDDEKQEKDLCVDVNPEDIQMMYDDEEGGCAITFNNGRNIVAKESKEQIREKLKQLDMMVI